MSRSFWGLTLSPEQSYSLVVKVPLHISMACIEPSSVTVGADLNCVYLKRSMANSFVESKDEFLLCSLGSTNLNAILRFYFKEGEVLHFRIKGTGTINLTGFLLESPEKMTKWTRAPSRRLVARKLILPSRKLPSWANSASRPRTRSRKLKSWNYFTIVPFICGMN